MEFLHEITPQQKGICFIYGHCLHHFSQYHCPANHFFFEAGFHLLCLSGCAHRPAVDLAERHRSVVLLTYIPAEKMTAKLFRKETVLTLIL